MALPREKASPPAAEGTSPATQFFREHAPLYRLLSKIPTRINHSLLVSNDLSLTCVAAHPRFVALGTSAGLVYWYDRELDTLRRLWCKDRKAPVTKLALVESVDFMLAAGNKLGCVTIFQIVRPVDKRIFPLMATACGDNDAEIFTMEGVHCSSISSLEWAINGMKLFSGDVLGLVCVSEIDFDAKVASSRPICKENESIVQMSYSKEHLLISTMERSVFCKTSSGAVSVVGQKPRKVKGPYGGLITKASNPFEGLVVRPKNTFYLAQFRSDAADCEVKATVLMDSLIRSPHLEMPLVNPVIFSLIKASESSDFHRVVALDGECFVVHNDSELHVVRPSVPSVLASCRGLRAILDLSASSPSEIFVLEGSRSVIRLGMDPDPYGADVLSNESNGSAMNPLGDDQPEGVGIEAVGARVLAMSESVVGSLPPLPAISATSSNLVSSLGEKLMSMVPLAQQREQWLRRRASSASLAEEALGDSLEVDDVILPDRLVLDFQDINMDDNGENVFVSKPLPRGRKKSSRKNVSPADQRSNCSSASSSRSASASNLLDVVRGENSRKVDASDEESAMSFAANVKMEECAKVEGDLEESEADREERLMAVLRLEEFMPKAPQVKTTEEPSTPTSPPQATESDSLSTITEERSSIESRSLAYGPPSDTSSVMSTQQHGLNASTRSYSHSEQEPSSLFSGMPSPSQTSEAKPFEFDPDWQELSVPGSPSDLCVVKEEIYVIDGRHNVFLGKMSPTSVEWSKCPFSAERISISASGSVIWAINHQGRMQACRSIARKEWAPLPVQAEAFAVNDLSACVVTQAREVVQYKDLGSSLNMVSEDKQVKLELDEAVSHVAMTNSLMLVITKSGKLVARVGMSHTNQAGTGWSAVLSAESMTFQAVDAIQLQARDGRDVFRVAGVTRNHDVVYAQGSLDDLVFDAGLAWHHICLHGATTSNDQTIVRLGLTSLWITSPNLSSLYRCQTSFKGSHWKKVVLRQDQDESKEREGYGRIKEIAAGGLYSFEGVLWATQFSLKPNVTEICFSKFHDGLFHRVSLPLFSKMPVVCVASAPEACWMLMSNGDILMRQGIRLPEKPEGKSWVKLDMRQLQSEGVTLQHLALGADDAAWAVDNTGNAWLRLGKLAAAGSRNSSGAVPAWIPIEAASATSALTASSASDKTPVRLSKICASSSYHVVWALDYHRSVFVREGIFPDFRLGVDWVNVGGVSAVSICASATAVWALSVAGRVFTRRGVTSSNFIGDYWQEVCVPPVSIITALSVSSCNKAYAVDCGGSVLELEHEEISLTKAPKIKAAVAKVSPDSIEGGWALVD